MNAIKIGLFIKERRKVLDITQQDIADELNVTRENVSKWERGISIPGSEYLNKLSSFLKITISELLAGELSENIEEQSNKVIVDIIDSNKAKVKKMMFTFCSILIIMIFSFLLYYFINNYNSIKVYRITGDSQNFDLYESFLMFSKEKIYLNINKIDSYHNLKITKLKLYYLDKNKKKVIVETNDLEGHIIDNSDSKESLIYNKRKTIIKNLYLELSTEKFIETIKLKAKEDFTNDFSNNKKDESLDKTKNNTSKELIDSNCLSKFKYNQENNEYIYSKTKNGIKTNVYYYPNEKCVVVKEYKNNKEINRWQYQNMINKKLAYYAIDGSIIINYHFEDKSYEGDLKYKEKIDYFIEKYLDKYCKI